jgi:hypothetical protein
MWENLEAYRPDLWHALTVYVKTPVHPRLLRGMDQVSPNETRSMATARISKRLGVAPHSLIIVVGE